MIELTVNGKEQLLDGPTNLMVYLESMGLNMRQIAIAYNGTVLHKEELPDVMLSKGDQLEIVNAVGGGSV